MGHILEEGLDSPTDPGPLSHFRNFPPRRLSPSGSLPLSHRALSAFVQWSSWEGAPQAAPHTKKTFSGEIFPPPRSAPQQRCWVVTLNPGHKAKRRGEERREVESPHRSLTHSPGLVSLSYMEPAPRIQLSRCVLLAALCCAPGYAAMPCCCYPLVWPEPC